MNTRAGNRQQPADILRQNEMPGRPHRVGPDQRSGGKHRIQIRIRRAFGTLSHPPFGMGILLRLYRDEMANCRLRTGGRRPS